MNSIKIWSQISNMPIFPANRYLAILRNLGRLALALGPIYHPSSKISFILDSSSSEVRAYSFGLHCGRQRGLRSILGVQHLCWCLRAMAHGFEQDTAVVDIVKFLNIWVVVLKAALIKHLIFIIIFLVVSINCLLPFYSFGSLEVLSFILFLSRWFFWASLLGLTSLYYWLDEMIDNFMHLREASTVLLEMCHRYLKV